MHTPSNRFEDVVAKAYRALCEFRVEGVATNAPFLQALLQHPEMRAGQVHTRFVEERIGEILGGAQEQRRLFAEALPSGAAAPAGAPATAPRLAGVKVSADPLAVLDFGKSGDRSGTTTATVAPAVAAPTAFEGEGPMGTVAVSAPLQGTIVELNVAEGDTVREGQQLLVMEAMKMQHVVAATLSGYVRQFGVAIGDAVFEGHPLVFIEPAEVEDTGEQAEHVVDLDYIRPDLKLIHDRHAITLDASRPDAVEKRRKTGQRTARENIDDLCDPGTFLEHGSLVLTPGTGLPIDEVVRKFPTDGMITGVGSVNGDLFEAPETQCAILAYDYTVLAGTQGALNHPKTDRMLELAEKWRMPVLFYTEGGGGRAGTGGQRPGGQRTAEVNDFAGRPLDTPTFTTMGRLSGLVPMIAINSGYCFAGNASLLATPPSHR